MTPCWGNTFSFVTGERQEQLTQTLIVRLYHIWYHNVCIEIESLGYLFIFTLSALGDKDKSDFVRYIIGENKI